MASNDYLTCRWTIKINGKALSADRKKCIKNLDIENRCNGSDTLSFSVADPDFKFIEDKIFLENVKVYAEIGWDVNTFRVKFNGYISALDIDFPTDGFPTLQIFCLDKSHIMNRKKKKRSWKKTTSATVVKKIAKSYGFKCSIQKGYTFPRQDSISQSNQTDLAFLESLASQETVPFLCKLGGNTIIYKKIGILSTSKYTLNYRSKGCEIMSFRPKINIETRTKEVKKYTIKASTKKTQKGKATKK